MAENIYLFDSNDIDLRDTSRVVLQTCKQYDDILLSLNLFYDGNVLDLTPYTIDLRALKPDGTFIIQTTDITKSVNNVNIKCIRDITRVAGKLRCELRLVNGETKQKTSFDFIIPIKPSVINDDSVGSRNIITILEELNTSIATGTILHNNLLNDIDVGSDLHVDLGSDISAGNILKTNLENVTNTANTTKTNLETATTNANNKKVELEGVISTADTSKTELVNATNLADAKKTELDTSIANAQDDINTILSAGNKSFTIPSTAWIGTEPNLTYTLTHNLNSKSLIVQVVDTDSQKSMLADYRYVDMNSIELQSIERKNVTVSINASYYTGKDANTIAQEVIDARKGEVSLKSKIDGIDSQLADNAKKIKGRKSILDYEHLVIGKGLITEDWKVAFDQAVKDLRSANPRYKLVFPSGVYQYSVSPNWAMSNVVIESEGIVRLRYTGTENAILIDGTIFETGWNMKFGRFLIECPSIAKDACVVRGVHGSIIDIKVLGSGSEYAGLRVEACVCTTFPNYTCSVNHEGWYKNSKPKYGLIMDWRESIQSGYPSWCTFYDPKIEGCQVGAYLIKAQGCSFYNGTIEGNSVKGLLMERTTMYNKFFGVDFEMNPTFADGDDIVCAGTQNEFYDIDNMGKIKFVGLADENLVVGGSHCSIILEETTKKNLITGVKYNRFKKTDVINDVSGKNTLLANSNVASIFIENRPPSHEILTLDVSPYTYTNNTGNDVNVNIINGTIQSVAYYRGNFAQSFAVAPTFIRLCPGDRVRINYTVAPTVTVFTT